MIAKPDIVDAGRSTRWQPGQSGNPSGRPKVPTMADVLRERVESELEAWIAPYIAARDSGDKKLAMEAAERVFDRLYGKATRRMEHAGGLTLEEVLLPVGLLDDDLAEAAG